MRKKLMSFVLSVLCVLGVVSVPVQAEAAGEPGYVNLQAIFAAYPDINTVGINIQEEQKKLQQEYNSQAQNLNDKDKAALEKELSQRLTQKQMEIMQPIRDSVIKAIAEAAKAKDIGYVVNAEGMVYGGTDLTQDVINIIRQK